MRPESVLDALESHHAGYWGTDAGQSEVNVRAVRNGDVGTGGQLRWTALPVRGFKDQERRRAQLHVGDIVITSSGNCGEVAYIEVEPPEPTCVTNFVRLLRPNREVCDPRYLFHFLRQESFRRSLAPFIRGTAIKNLSVEAALGQTALALPSLEEQRRIAAILDHADALRAKRRDVIAHLDTLARAIFAGMFALDGVSAETTALGNVADFYAGGSLPVGTSFASQTDGHLLMKVSDMNLAGNETLISRTQLWSARPGARAATAPAGSVVLPKRGASIATNKKRVTTRSTVLDPNLMAVHPHHDRLRLRYLFAWFEQFDLTSITSGSSVPQLNKKDLAPLPVPVPPLHVQDQFGERLAALDHVRTTAVGQLDKLDALFASLQDRAFSGGL